MAKFFLSFVLVLFFTQSAFARPPQCGEIERETLDEVYESARKIDNYYNVIPDIKNICSDLERFQDWQKDNADILLDETFLYRKNALLDHVRLIFSRMEAPLMVISLWYRSDPKDTVEKVIRIKRLRDAKAKVNIYLDDLRKSRRIAVELMEYFRTP